MRGCRDMIVRMLFALGLAFLGAVPGRAGGEGQPAVCVARVQGTIGPATASYLARARDLASGRGAQCLIVQLDTPGGLLDSTREIIQGFLASAVPTVVFVAPPGAWAGSAGCFIALAADVAALAPTTSIGAAHPVGLGTGGEQLDPVMKKKIENFTSSYIEAIAAKRNHNPAWARTSVSESAAITADRALELHVIDLIARDLPDLLRQLDGREVAGRTLRTSGAALVEVPMTYREKVFQVLAHPQVMLILMLVVMYGLIGELTSPGAILPGVAGAVAMVLLLYLASVLPMTIAGLALVAVAIALFIIDAFTPTHGVLTMGGTVAFFLGTFMLFDRSEPFLRLSLAWLAPATAVTVRFFTFLVGAGLRAQRAPARAGAEAMVGQRALALGRIDAEGGKVFVEGETWNAVSREPVAAGAMVAILARDGLTLRVAAATPAEKEAP